MPLDVTSSRNGTVLIVEDEAALRELLVEALADCGFRVLEAGSGTTARNLIESFGARPDVLVTDVKMPGMAGPEIAAVARSMVPHIRVIYMSGYTDDSGLKDELASGRAEYIQKPFGTEALCERVSCLLSAQRH